MGKRKGVDVSSPYQTPWFPSPKGKKECPGVWEKKGGKRGGRKEGAKGNARNLYSLKFVLPK